MLKTVLSFDDFKKAADAGKPIHISCPHCKAQYLPGEIYMPGAFFGVPIDVVKDSFGKIICVDYRDVDKMPNNTETFVCEYCEQPFKVETGYITYKATKTEPETNFKQTYVSLID